MLVKVFCPFEIIPKDLRTVYASSVISVHRRDRKFIPLTNDQVQNKIRGFLSPISSASLAMVVQDRQVLILLASTFTWSDSMHKLDNKIHKMSE